MTNLRLTTPLIYFFIFLSFNFSFSKGYSYYRKGDLNVTSEERITIDFGNYNAFKNLDSIQTFRAKAIHYSRKNDSISFTKYIQKYIKASGDISILNDHFFQNMRGNISYENLKNKYQPKFNILNVIYFFAGFLGVFLFIIINSRKSGNRINNLLISTFVLFNSLFIVHLTIYMVSIQYYFPHCILITTSFSFLYGPLIYFYFKRSILKYRFKWIDVFHLVPTVVLLGFLIPVYSLPADEKLRIILNNHQELIKMGRTIIILKMISLSIYAMFNLEIYLIDSKSNNDALKIKWQRSIIVFFIGYTITYILYAFVVMEIIKYQYMIHLLILVMVILVFYVSYITYVKPELFHYIKKNQRIKDSLKYKNSGLTITFSEELKAELLKLLNEEKIFKDNMLNLDRLANKLNISRHHTSQIINEHFGVSFNELINFYRITEATTILKEDKQRDLKIIDVIYEVGFNNKVSFNRAFKKYIKMTPTEYLNSLK